MDTISEILRCWEESEYDPYTGYPEIAKQIRQQIGRELLEREADWRNTEQIVREVCKLEEE